MGTWVRMYIQVCMSVSIRVHMHVEAGDRCQEASLIALPLYSLRQGPQSNPELTDTSSLMSQLAVRILCLHLPMLELQAGFHAHT